MSYQNKKIVFLLHSINPNGGFERKTQQLINNFPANFNIHIVVLNDSKERINKNNVYYHCLNIRKPKKYNFLERLFLFFKRFLKIKGEFKKIDPDAIIVFSTSLGFISSMLSNKTVANFCNTLSVSENDFLSRLKIKFISLKAFRLVAISEGVKNDLVLNFGVRRHIDVIENPIDIKEARSRALEEDGLIGKFKEWVAEGRFIIITVGRLVPQKGQWHLIKIFSQIVKDNNNVRLCILGRGELEEKLIELSEKLEVKNKILFGGFAPNPFQYLYRGDLFVLTSLWEGFGNVLIEALAMRMPIISTDCPSGPREVLGYRGEKREINEFKICEWGIITPPFGIEKDFSLDSSLNDKEIEMMKAIKYIIKNKDKREEFSQKSKKRIEHYSINNWIEKFLNIINENNKPRQ